jgi:hypothetical protein
MPADRTITLERPRTRSGERAIYSPISKSIFDPRSRHCRQGGGLGQPAAKEAGWLSISTPPGRAGHHVPDHGAWTRRGGNRVAASGNCCQNGRNNNEASLARLCHLLLAFLRRSYRRSRRRLITVGQLFMAIANLDSGAALLKLNHCCDLRTPEIQVRAKALERRSRKRGAASIVWAASTLFVPRGINLTVLQSSLRAASPNGATAMGDAMTTLSCSARSI